MYPSVSSAAPSKAFRHHPASPSSVLATHPESTKPPPPIPNPSSHPPLFNTPFNSAFLFSNPLTFSSASLIFSNKCIALCFVGLGPESGFQLPLSKLEMSFRARSSDSQDLMVDSADSRSLVLKDRSWVAWKTGSRKPRYD